MSSDFGKRDTMISKALSYILRHGAIKENLEIDSLGYVKADQLLNHNRLKTHKTTLDDILRVVENNNKKRFTLMQKDNELYICANQGHSMKEISDSTLKKLERSTIPSVIYHGTYVNVLPQIISSGGLKKMGRNHIHFTTSGAISGIRHNANILIYLDVEKCLDRGLNFFESANGVILSPGDENGCISWQLFDKVVDTKRNKEIDINEFFK